MPNCNVVKIYDTNTYYHVYNRGVEKRNVFLDDQDYAVFTSLFKRYLSEKPFVGSKEHEYEWLANDVEVTAFCLMPNHFHLLLYQIEIDAITKLMRAVCSSYATYFNNKYDRVGSLFQGKFKAVRIVDEGQLFYLTRYIHRNPARYLDWEWSSLRNWIDNTDVVWLKHQRLNNMNPVECLNFINDNDDYATILDSMSDIAFDIENKAKK